MCIDVFKATAEQKAPKTQSRRLKRLRILNEDITELLNVSSAHGEKGNGKSF